MTARDTEYDAIVVGTGISGGWAAKELCERGLRTLVLERGPDVRHIQDYPTAYKAPWELPHGGRLTRKQREQQPVQSRWGGVNQATRHFFVDDQKHAYVAEKPFDWIRGYQVGGRSLLWSRQCYRLSDLDFEANAKEGVGVDWPIRYADLAPWYSHVERHIGVNGSREGLAHLPDGEFLPPMEMNCLEQAVAGRIRAAFPERRMIIGRSANLTRAHGGRSQCMYRNLCSRGCPFGAYFSSQSSTLPAARATGRMTLRPHSIVSHVLFDDATQRASGVAVIDAETHKSLEFSAKVVFVNASALGSTAILLNSTSKRFPRGLGNDSGELGHNLMDHLYGSGAHGQSEEFAERYYSGRRPNGIYVPRFRNLGTNRAGFLRGYGFQGRAQRGHWTDHMGELSLLGGELKQAMAQPGSWEMGLGGFGEMLPHHNNRISLSKTDQDEWGLPRLSINCQFRDNELKMREDIKTTAAEMLEAAGLKNVQTFERHASPGRSIHEMGTARMGRDPKTSVLNGHNQVHAVKNVFVTDGACMTSSACQNPSLTYMALTARAAAFAADELKKGNL